MANRAQYDDRTKAIVRAKYPLCRTPADRDALARELGIDSRQKLYNLASRLLATRPHSGSAGELIEVEPVYDARTDLRRLYLRDKPEETVWTPDQDRYITEHFGRTHIESIGFYLNRSETAVAYRARHLRLRSIPKYYDLEKVAPWLGMTKREVLALLPKRGLKVHPCTDQRGRLRITLVSTPSLARVLLKDWFWKVLVDKRNADRFFIKDIVESMASMMRGEATWEFNCWVSHGHTSLNPFSDVCFGMFYTRPDEYMAGEDLTPEQLSPSANVASDDWRRSNRPVVISDEADDDNDMYADADQASAELGSDRAEAAIAA
jgi:hypothetical protein